MTEKQKAENDIMYTRVSSNIHTDNSRHHPQGLLVAPFSRVTLNTIHKNNPISIHKDDCTGIHMSDLQHHLHG